MELDDDVVVEVVEVLDVDEVVELDEVVDVVVVEEADEGIEVVDFVVDVVDEVVEVVDVIELDVVVEDAVDEVVVSSPPPQPDEANIVASKIAVNNPNALLFIPCLLQCWSII